jgi:fructose-bisphosphate aldolase, class I
MAGQFDRVLLELGEAPEKISARRSIILLLVTFPLNHGVGTACPQKPGDKLSPLRPGQWSVCSSRLGRQFAKCWKRRKVPVEFSAHRFSHFARMNTHDLEETARSLVAPGKGILAADESSATIEKRFKTIGVASTEETRRAYRELLFTTPELSEFISGVILFDETIRQMTHDGTSVVDVLTRQGIIPGIKVDRGAKPLAGFPGEKITEGLDGLRDRLLEYARLGARFTKWRAVIVIGPELPTQTCLRANAHALARFAALSQEAGLVPIVEPEVLMDGDHTIDRHFEVTESALKAVFETLFEHHVHLEGMLLKPNMVLTGKDCWLQADVSQVAEATLGCLLRTVPAAVPGIVFLSGGQSDVLATEHLTALNRLRRAPWELSFSFGRALQAAALNAWRGSEENVGLAQAALRYRAQCNSAARSGMHIEEIEQIVDEDVPVAT